MKGNIHSFNKHGVPILFRVLPSLLCVWWGEVRHRTGCRSSGEGVKDTWELQDAEGGLAEEPQEKTAWQVRPEPLGGRRKNKSRGRQGCTGSDQETWTSFSSH